MIQPNFKIIVLEGKNYDSQTNSIEVVELIITNNSEYIEHKYRLNDF